MLEVLPFFNVLDPFSSTLPQFHHLGPIVRNPHSIISFLTLILFSRDLRLSLTVNYFL